MPTVGAGAGAHMCNRPGCAHSEFSSLGQLNAHMKELHGVDVVEAMMDSFFDSDEDEDEEGGGGGN